MSSVPICDHTGDSCGGVYRIKTAPLTVAVMTAVTAWRGNRACDRVTAVTAVTAPVTVVAAVTAWQPRL